MLTWIREKFGTVVIGGIIGFIAFVFVFYGVFNPKATRGLHDGAVAGTVNGDSISISEYRREYDQRARFYREMMKVSDEQLKNFHLGRSIFQDLVRRKLMLQEATRMGMLASDEEVRDKIREIQAFQKGGKFDVATYKEVLDANNLSAGGFERLTREQISEERWVSYFKNRVHVADAEIQSQFLLNNDKRTIKFVALNIETGKRGLQIDSAEIQKFLKDPAKMSLVKSEYDAKKATLYKDKPFEAVQDSIARSLIAGDKIADIRKLNDKLGDEIAGLLLPNGKDDAKINAMLKPYGVEVKSSGSVTAQSTFLPGAGDAKEVFRDAFLEKSPIEGKAKKYDTAMGVVVAVITASEKPDLSKLDAQRTQLAAQIASKKQSEIFNSWMQGLLKKAKVEPNMSVIGDGESEG